MSNDKSLRDIWTVTDKMSMDVLRAAGGVPESCNASVIATTSSREKCRSYISNETQESYLKSNFDKQPIPSGLFLQPHKENAEDDTMSMISSIWTPTIKDECVIRKDFQKNPLLVVKIPGKDTLQEEDKSAISTDNSNENLISFTSDSELSNNCGSDESQDELNDETFGKLSSAKSEMTMSNISEATANCEVLKKKIQNENWEIKKNESTDSDNSVDTIIEKNHDKSPKKGFNSKTTRLNSQAKTKPNNVKSSYIQHNRRRRRNMDSKALSSEFSHLGMDSDEVLSVSRENLTIQESHSSSRKGGRMSNVKKNIAIETREVMGKKGTTKKITYVRGKIVEETNGLPNKNLKWNTDLCNLNIQNRNSSFPDNFSTFNKTPQTKLVEPNANKLYNAKNIRSSTFRQFTNGRLVVDDCLRMNEHFTRHDRRDFFKPVKKDFEILKKETRRDPLYEPRYRPQIENPQDNKKNTSQKNFSPNYPTNITNRAPFYQPRYNFQTEDHLDNSKKDTIPKSFSPDFYPNITNRAYLERKIINASQGYHKTVEEDMRSEVSWTIVKPEKEIERKTVGKKIFAEEKPTQTLLEGLSKSCQTSIKVNQGDKNAQLPKPFLNGPSYDQANDYYTFPENLKTTKKIDAETVPKCITKPPTTEFYITKSLSRSAKLKEERAQKKSLLIENGKEVADLIVGCHRAVDVFSSFYHEWLEIREQSINLLEKITVAIVKCGSKNEKISNLIARLNIAAGSAGFIPLEEETFGDKLAAVIGDFVTKLFGNELNEKDRNAKESKVRLTFQRDIDTSSMVYIYGVQCSSQFEDTCSAIKALHQRTQQDSLDLLMTDPSVIKFLKEISDHNPSNVAVFYKRLRFEYEMLIKDSKSEEGRDFTRVFKVTPQAVPVIDLLPWKFEPDGFDNSIVRNAWKELFTIFNDKGLSTNDDYLRKVQNCLFFLKKEKAIFQRNVKRLLN